MSAPSAGVAPGSELVISQVLRRRAQACPDRVAYEFVDGDGRCETLTYGELAARCQVVAARLEDGQRRPALVCYPPGLDYVVAMLGCVAADVPAIPAYPPQPWNRQAVLRRLAHIRRDAGPVQILADPETASVLGGPSGAGRSGAVRPDPQPAVIQYTSGSTAAPRGVVVTRANLTHNMTAIAATYGLDASSQGVCWLPPYHDMGLITGVLLPLFAGYPVRLFSPVDFLRDPLVWLRQISVTSATFSGAPNFAYDLCVRRVTGADLDKLDLGSWSAAFNGAEPVRQRTLEQFAAAFAPAGFRAGALAPSYGLAEATLLVSAGYWRPGRPAGNDGRVSCGRPLADQDLVVADPVTGQRAADGQEGEVWLRGPSVTPGYWAGGATAPHESGELDGRVYLRTGDLGYLRDGELVITGRVKDLIIRNGVNYHPEDIEVATLPGPVFRPVCAAFGVETGAGAAACLALESARAPAPGGAGSPAAEAEAIRGRVLRQVGLWLDTVLVLPAGTIPRTSSGKVCRRECQELFLSGAWDQYVAAGAATKQVADPAGDGDLERSVTELVGAVFAAACAVPDCPSGTSIFEIGGDSVRAAEAAGVLGHALGVDVSVTVVLEQACPSAVSRQLLDALDGPKKADLARRIAELGGHDD
jgi:acyl-CoA synthetase (AMP-forming)/AMP-acid ligase II